jgi:hypothetical protein
VASLVASGWWLVAGGWGRSQDIGNTFGSGHR